MNPVERLLKQLEARGLRVLPGAEPGQLLLNGPKAEKTPAVMEAVKAFKPQLLALVGRGAATREPETAPDPEPESRGPPP